MAGRHVRRRTASEVFGRTVDSIYIDGNTVRRIEKRFEEDSRPIKRGQRRYVEIEKTEPLVRISAGYYIFLFLAFVISAAVCIWYVQVRSEITASQKEVSRLEKELSQLRQSNDEEYERILGAVDLEAIKKIAMRDMHMSYPREEQVIGISNESDDYVRQYGDIPEE